MKGLVRRIVENRNFGFIKTSNGDYFFHREEFSGHWNDLVADLRNGLNVEVEFEEVDSPKGPRAANVVRTDDIHRRG